MASSDLKLNVRISHDGESGQTDIRVGDWICFLSGAQLSYGRIEYIYDKGDPLRPKLHAFNAAPETGRVFVTNVGSIPESHVLEHRMMHGVWAYAIDEARRDGARAAEAAAAANTLNALSQYVKENEALDIRYRANETKTRLLAERLTRKCDELETTRDLVRTSLKKMFDFLNTSTWTRAGMLDLIVALRKKLDV